VCEFGIGLPMRIGKWRALQAATIRQESDSRVPAEGSGSNGGAGGNVAGRHWRDRTRPPKAPARPVHAAGTAAMGKGAE
jgi:hypothetical protein